MLYDFRNLLLGFLLCSTAPTVFGDDFVEGYNSASRSDGLVRSNNEFTVQLLQTLASQQDEASPDNLCFSPYSIYSTLFTAREGAMGATHQQMSAVLRAVSNKTIDPDEFRAFIEGQRIDRLDAAQTKQLQLKISSLREKIDQIDAKGKNANGPTPKSNHIHHHHHAPNTEKLRLQGELNQSSQILGGPVFSVANASWLDTKFPVSPDYENRLTQIGVSIFASDFRNNASKERVRINSWVAEQTQGKIGELFGPDAVTSETVLALTNAVYFRADWQSPFESDSTRLTDFVTSTGKRLKVDMMTNLGMDECRYAAFNADGSQFKTPDSLPVGGNLNAMYPAAGGGQLIELPYSGTDLTMVIMLPRTSDGMKKLCERLTANRINELVGFLNEQTTNVSIPRFKLKSQLDLESPLKRMGMPVAFSNAADFSRMTTGEAKGIKIGRVIHKAVVEVDEQGTEAAAATAMTFQAHSGRFHPAFTPTFTADHPFLFLVRDSQSGLILFVGRVEQPEER